MERKDEINSYVQSKHLMGTYNNIINAPVILVSQNRKMYALLLNIYKIKYTRGWL